MSWAGMVILKARFSPSFNVSTVCIVGSNLHVSDRPASNSGGPLVRAKGLEPPHLSIPGPKPGASTSSATPAGPRQGGVYNSAGQEGKRLAGRGAAAKANMANAL